MILKMSSLLILYALGVGLYDELGSVLEGVNSVFCFQKVLQKRGLTRI